MGSRQFTQAAVLKALEASHGFVSEAARVLGTSYHTLYRRIARTPALKEAQEDILERQLDIAESKLMVAINDGQAWAIRFFLRCKGKHRGYVERGQPTSSATRDHLHEVLAAFKAGPVKRGACIADGE